MTRPVDADIQAAPVLLAVLAPLLVFVLFLWMAGRAAVQSPVHQQVSTVSAQGGQK